MNESVMATAVADISNGPDLSMWFGIRRAEWEQAIKANPAKYAGIDPLKAYAKKMFNEYFTNHIRKTKPDCKIGTLPAYRHVLDWAISNRGKGLLLIGDCGTGKTVNAQIITEMLADGCGMWHDANTDTFYPQARTFKRFSAIELINPAFLDEALAHRLVYVDDIGTEQETAINYGQRRNPIAELIDNAERNNCLLILTSNLTGEDLLQKYGQRTIDRLNAICTTVVFRGNSFRNGQI